MDDVFPDLVVELGESLLPFLVELFRSMHRGVWDGRGNVAEEGFLGLGIRLDELHRVIHDDVMHKGALLQGDLLAIVDVGGWIVGVRNGLALPSAKLIKSVRERILNSLFMGVTKPPFPIGPGGISRRFKNFGKDCLRRVEWGNDIFLNVGAQVDLARLLARHKHRAGGTADRVS